MTKAQRNAILEAHDYRVNYPNGRRDGHIATRSGARNHMIMRMITARLLDLEGRVTLTALRAAGVDIDALHAEALVENLGRKCLVDGADSPRGRVFLAAILAPGPDSVTTYRNALDVLHVESLDEARDRDLDAQVMAEQRRLRYHTAGCTSARPAPRSTSTPGAS